MTIDEIATIEPSWLSENCDDGDPITLFSSARIRRNAKGYPFPRACSKSQLYDLAAMLLGTAGRCSLLSECDFQMVDELDVISRELLLESHTITGSFSEGGPGRFLLRDCDGVLTCMINENDHLCVTAVRSGFSLQSALKQAADLTEDIKMDCASDPVLGILTASPDHVGTGTVLSIAMHLPALDISGEIGRTARAFEREWSDRVFLSKLAYDDLNNTCGSFYVVSNKVTLGSSPEELAGCVSDAAHSIASKELFARHRSMHSKNADMTDRFWRAWGLLQYARKLTYPEAINKVSFIKLGSDLGILPKVDETAWRRLLIGTKRAHLCLACGRVLDPSEEPFVRASTYRRFIDKAGSAAALPVRPRRDKEMQK